MRLTDNARKLARLIKVLHQGEVLAARVALQQSRIAPVLWMRRALAVQAAQERNHAVIAAMAVRIASGSTDTPDTTASLRWQLGRDLAAGDLASSLLGLQGVVEHLGEALLERMGRHVHPAGAVLHALRTKVLAQEHGHVLLGKRCLQTLGPRAGRADALDHYRALGHSSALHVASLLDDARFDADAFWRDVNSRLDDWASSSASAAGMMPV